MQANLHLDNLSDPVRVTAEAKHGAVASWVSIDTSERDHVVVFTETADKALDIAVAFLQLYADLADKDVAFYHSEDDEDGTPLPLDRIGSVLSRTGRRAPSPFTAVALIPDVHEAFPEDHSQDRPTSITPNGTFPEYKR